MTRGVPQRPERPSADRRVTPDDPLLPKVEQLALEGFDAQGIRKRLGIPRDQRRTVESRIAMLRRLGRLPLDWRGTRSE